MKKIVYAIALLAVGVPMIQSCIDDKVSPGVENVRNGLAEKYEGEAYLAKAEADAKIILAEADASIRYAEAQIKLAEAARIKAETELLDVQKQLNEIKVKMQQVQLAQDSIELQKKYYELLLLQEQYRYTVAENNAKIELLANMLQVQADSTKLELQKIANALLEEQLKELQNQNKLDNANSKQMSKLLTAYNQAMTDYLDAVALLYQYKSALSSLEFNTQKEQENYIYNVNLQNTLISELTADLADWSARLAKYEAYAEYTDTTVLRDAIVDARIAEIEALQTYKASNDAYLESQEAFIKAQRNLNNTYYYQNGVQWFTQRRINYYGFNPDLKYYSPEYDPALGYYNGATATVKYDYDDNSGVYTTTWYVLTLPEADEIENSMAVRDTIPMLTYSYSYVNLSSEVPAPGVIGSIGSGSTSSIPTPGSNDYIYVQINDYYSYNPDGIQYYLDNYDFQTGALAHATEVAQAEAALTAAQTAYENYMDAPDYYWDSYAYYEKAQAAYEEQVENFAPYKANAEKLWEAVEEAADGDVNIVDLQNAYYQAVNNYQSAYNYLTSAQSLAEYWADAIDEETEGGLYSQLEAAQEALEEAEAELDKAQSATPVDQSAVSEAQTKVNNARASLIYYQNQYTDAQVNAQKWAAIAEVAETHLEDATTAMNEAYETLDSATADYTAYQAAYKAWVEYTGYNFNDEGNPGNSGEYPDGNPTPYMQAYQAYQSAKSIFYGQYDPDATDPVQELWDSQNPVGEQEDGIDYVEWTSAAAYGNYWHYENYITYCQNKLDEVLAQTPSDNESALEVAYGVMQQQETNIEALVAAYNSAYATQAQDYVTRMADLQAYAAAAGNQKALLDIERALENGEVIQETGSAYDPESGSYVSGQNWVYRHIYECQLEIEKLNKQIDNAYVAIENLQDEMERYYNDLNYYPEDGNNSMNFDFYVQYLNECIAAQEEQVEVLQAEVDAAKAAIEAYKEKMANSGSSSDDNGSEDNGSEDNNTETEE